MLKTGFEERGDLTGNPFRRIKNFFYKKTKTTHSSRVESFIESVNYSMFDSVLQYEKRSFLGGLFTVNQGTRHSLDSSY